MDLIKDPAAQRHVPTEANLQFPAGSLTRSTTQQWSKVVWRFYRAYRFEFSSRIASALRAGLEVKG